MLIRRKPRIRQVEVQLAYASRGRELGRRGGRGQRALQQSCHVRSHIISSLALSHSTHSSCSGYCAFTHKAGIHAKAILNNPSTYEILKPEDFGLTRYVSIGHRLTGWNAVKSRVEQLGLKLTDEEIKDATAKIKELADVRTQSMDDVDSLLRVYHSGIQSGELAVGQKETLDRLLAEHRQEQKSA